MKILAPVNNPGEIEPIIRAGADEIYCGILNEAWMNDYGNVASGNRREWKTANLKSFKDLREITERCHAYNVPVYLALNALYSKKQYPLLREQLDEVQKIGLDAVIVADLGLLLEIKRLRTSIDVHMSTGASTFNSQTVDFYKEFGVSRVVLPRHLRVDEIKKIVEAHPSVRFETFILNSGCKNIDSFCTFHHGVKEIKHHQLWDFLKKLNFDRHLLNLVRQLPREVSCRFRTNVFGADSACLLNYKVAFSESSGIEASDTAKTILQNIRSNFSLLSGVDTCGVCRLAEFSEMGVFGVKIVGRNYSKEKKVNDVLFLKEAISKTKENFFEKKEFFEWVRSAFKKRYKMKCGDLCYYPDGM